MVNKELLKMYVPDGNLEKFVMGLLESSGFEPTKKDREYRINTNSDLWEFKQMRPQDQPYQVSKGNGDLCIVGEDILQEFNLRYPTLCDNVEILETFEGRPTKLVAVVLDEFYKGITDLNSFFTLKGEDARVASEYPYITKDYIKTNFGLDIDVYRPLGKTEATLIGPRPEMDLIFETTETGNTIRATGGKILDTIMESRQVAVVNSKSYQVPDNCKNIDNLMEQFRGVMYSNKKNLKKLQVNVLDNNATTPVIEYLVDNGYRPTVSKIYPEGQDIYIVLPDRDIKDISPYLAELGCSDMVVTPLERLLYPSKGGVL
ncbi:MAG: ATP phosphoribosyltransferase [DPANN group archaeon]|nr:ATP phosphoribosyltransferase [DPANN group archaeon]